MFYLFVNFEKILVTVVMFISGGTALLKEIASLIADTMIDVIRDMSATAGTYGAFICFIGALGIVLICIRYGVSLNSSV